MLFYDNFSFLAKLIVLFHNVFIEPDLYPCRCFLSVHSRVLIMLLKKKKKNDYNVHISPHEAKDGTHGPI